MACFLFLMIFFSVFSFFIELFSLLKFNYTFSWNPYLFLINQGGDSPLGFLQVKYGCGRNFLLCLKNKVFSES